MEMGRRLLLDCAHIDWAGLRSKEYGVVASGLLEHGFTGTRLVHCISLSLCHLMRN